MAGSAAALGVRPRRPLPPLTATRPAGGAHPWFEPVSWEPRAFVAHNFASQEETDHVIGLAQPLVRQAPGRCGTGPLHDVGACTDAGTPCTPPAQLKRSTVVGSRGESVVDEYRTSYGMFIK